MFGLTLPFCLRAGLPLPTATDVTTFPSARYRIGRWTLDRPVYNGARCDSARVSLRKDRNGY